MCANEIRSLPNFLANLPGLAKLYPMFLVQRLVRTILIAPIT